MSSATELFLPSNLPYPIKLVSLDARPLVSVQRGTRLLSYSFVYPSTVANSKPETGFGTWDCSVEGTVDAWKVRAGDIISEQRAKDRPVILVSEPCKHGVQVGGLCCLCGKDMTGYDYTGFSDASRASIQMTHSAFGPTVSLEEAQKIEKETADHLLNSRKLSLIVDLDQTIVHATVDPTVATDSESDDECNPNWEALKDVRKFQLVKGKQKFIENEGCMYYIKPRPGWQHFLHSIANKYEMHVYTMGTRAYAEEVCAAIDPDGTIFGGRILSRDESGSLTQKSLQRLFPCDTSMVVIIDDRADVWEWSPNLVKVIPYDFFVGIGDINSTFLPKVQPLTTAIPPVPGNTASPAILSPPVLTTEALERNELASKTLLTQNSLALEAQVEERPLAKKQEELRFASDDGKVTEVAQETPAGRSATGCQEKQCASTKPDKGVRQALLNNDDVELQRVKNLLEDIHRRFFGAYDSRSPEGRGKKRKTSLLGRYRPDKPYDVTKIIPSMRKETLDGIHILFSSVIPLDTKPETTEIWKVAEMFGAQCCTELSSRITHVVAAKHGTVKVDAARKRGGIKIVWLSWFTDSIALWSHQDETPYLLDEPPTAGPSSSPTLDPNQISSDPEPDGDDWDLDPLTVGTQSNLKSFGLAEIDWDDINDEVDAAMNESDDDDTRSARSMANGNVSNDDGDATDIQSRVSGVASTPRHNRKRLRNTTPSDIGNEWTNQRHDDTLRSPLAKRKKVAAGRSGSSRLKEAISAEDLDDDPESAVSEHSGGNNSSGIPQGIFDGLREEEEEEEGDGDDEDDFLARELEEEWG
ncbi:hypothetical protein SERLA73DRAFT_102556 [Serpula lacrymans var. lacrymans S7.3]|uniref:RNA polymerase II subunit A C-terminal domain phosphatase n=1 Tax=Serpula lacrymans var. lacrymans (strain S7.3) TaxID=936435 RepID=F8PLV3_SERL3|nr:hypothetical protein SERLA73DRAFT_102556 [Serpula lacrymans var. lacrymans S7.3]